MNLGRVALLSLALGAAACSAGAGIDVSIPAEVLAEPDWEQSFADDEMTVWRHGVVRISTGAKTSRIEDHPTVAGARVELFAMHPHGHRPLVKLAETTTDAEGRFRVGPGPATRWLLRGRHGDSIVNSAGRAPMMAGAFPLPNGGVTMLLRPGLPLAVTLVGAGDMPVEGARVQATAIGYDDVAVTDAQGVARFVAPEGGVGVEALDARRRGARSVFSVPMKDDATRYRLSAPDRGPIEGWVVDAATGAPLVGALVLHMSHPENFVRTDSAGRFALEGPREGRVAALGSGRGWRSYSVPSAGELEIRLGAARVVRGRVVGLDGQPVAGARLTAVGVNADGGTEPIRGPVSGPDGAFVFDWLPFPPRGADTDVSLAANRRGLGWSTAHEVTEVAADVELRLQGERTVRGLVTREQGGPIEAVAVTIEPDVEQLSPMVATLLGVSVATHCVTEADGSFEAPALPGHLACDVRLSVDSVRMTRRVEAGDGADVDVIVARGRAITGRVVDVAGQPVTLGGTVRAELMNHPEFAKLVRTAPIGPDGTFRIEDLPEGTYGVRGKMPSFEVGGTVAEAGDEGVELVAERPAPLHVELEFPVGAAPESVTVRLADATDPAVPHRTVHIAPDAPGLRGTFDLVRHGTYHITAAGGAWRCRLRDVEVQDGRRPPTRLVMERTLVRSMVLEDASGEPLVGRRVIVAPIGMQGVSAEQYRTGEGGVVEISGLAEGDWIARVVEEGRPPIEHRFVVSAEDRDEIRLKHRPHGTLEIVVDREAPGAQGDVIVALADSEGRPVVAWAPRARGLASRWRMPAEGSLVLRGVPVGRVTVSLISSSGERKSRDANVRGREQTTLRLP